MRDPVSDCTLGLDNTVATPGAGVAILWPGIETFILSSAVSALSMVVLVALLTGIIMWLLPPSCTVRPTLTACRAVKLLTAAWAMHT